MKITFHDGDAEIRIQIVCVTAQAHMIENLPRARRARLTSAVALLDSQSDRSLEYAQLISNLSNNQVSVEEMGFASRPARSGIW